MVEKKRANKVLVAAAKIAKTVDSLYERRHEIFKETAKGLGKEVEKSTKGFADIVAMPANILRDLGKLSKLGIKCIAKGNTKELEGFLSEKIAVNLEAMGIIAGQKRDDMISKYESEGYEKKGYESNPLSRFLGAYIKPVKRGLKEDSLEVKVLKMAREQRMAKR